MTATLVNKRSAPTGPPRPPTALAAGVPSWPGSWSACCWPATPW